MTQSPGITRKLTTLLSVDAANYTGRMARDEVATVQALRKARDVIDTHITLRGGRIANTSGDGLIAEFPSVVEAVAAAIAIQRGLRDRTDVLPFRQGVHLGDVIVEGEDLLGDGVNLAARLQEMAPEGGILVSQQVVDQVGGRLDAEFRPMGPLAVKHLPQDIPVFAIEADGVAAPRASGTAQQPPSRIAAQASQKSPRTKLQQTLLVLIGLLFLLDLVTGSGVGWFIFPSLPLAGVYVLIRLWSADTGPE